VQIDWFTLFAQIVNFLIVVVLLRRFLYKPILQAMAEREAKIAAQFEEAEAKTREAEEEAERYRAQRAELDEEIDALMAEATAKAAERRKAMVAEAREEVESMQDRWYAAIEHEKQLFLHRIRQRLGQQVFHIAKSALKDLADAELEGEIVDVFIQQLDAQEIEASTAPAHSSEPDETPIIVRSAFELDAPTRQRIKQAIQSRVMHDRSDGNAPNTVEVAFEQTPDLICGIETQFENRRIAWNLNDYLTRFEEELSTALTTELHVEERAHLYEQEAAANGILPG